MIRFLVFGKPVPFVRHRRGSNRDDAERYRTWKTEVGIVAKMSSGELLTGPLGMEIVVHAPYRGANFGDLDNIFKGIADALNKITYWDDRQLDHVLCDFVEHPDTFVDVTIATWDRNRRRWAEEECMGEESTDPPADFEPITCRCGNLVAKRHASGNVTVLGSHQMFIEQDGRRVVASGPAWRVAMNCPQCGHRVRFRLARVA